MLAYRVPRGVVGVITPWNWPYTMPSELLAPALASGNAVVWTPATSTSVCAVKLAECIVDAELPAGVFSMVTGPGAIVGDEIAGSAGTQAIAFIGSTETGDKVAIRAAGKPLLLELGGNGPLVVLEDADVAAAAEASVAAAFLCAGQSCTAGERFLVHESVHDEFLERLRETVVRTIRLGDPFTSTARWPPRRKASRTGATWPPAERSKIMRKAAGLMRERADDIAPLLTQEQGKPLAEAKGEAMAAADIIEWFAEEGLRVYGRIVPRARNLALRQMVLKDPVGPVAAFTPWNFPINQVVRKVGAALATGCSMIVKAPEETPAAPAALIRAFADAGLPPGVLGLVYGNPAEISELPDPAPGDPQDHLHRLDPGGQAARRAGRPAHEARHDGARRPRAGDRVRGRRHRARGQGRAAAPSSATRARSASRPRASWCTRASPNEFAPALAKHAQGLKVGDGLAEGTQMGPLANPRRLTAMAEFTRTR